VFFPHITHETMALPRESAEQPLLVATVAESAPNCRNPAAKGRSRNGATIPHRRNQVSTTDDPVAIADEMLHQIEHLRFDGDEISATPEFPPIGVK
jgi:hypothetical protein